MKKMTRFLSTLLAIAMTVTIIPTSVFATNTAAVDPMPSKQTAVPDDPSNKAKYPSYPTEGFVQMEKSAAWTDENRVNAEVKFDVLGAGVSTGVDAVVVFDRSGSMKDDTDVNCTGKYEEKTEYTYQCNAFLRWHEKTSFDANLKDTKCDKSGCSGKYQPLSKKQVYVCPVCDDRTSKISNVGKPCTEECDRITLAKTAATNFVDTMFAKTTGDTASKNRVALVAFSGIVEEDNKIDFAESTSSDTVKDKINSLKADGGTNYTDALEEAYKFINNRTDKSRPAYVIFMTDGKPEPSYDNGGEYPEKIKDLDAKIYSIAFDLDDDATQLLKTISSGDGYFHSATSDLDAVFGKIANNLKQAGTNAVITDTINADFELRGTKADIKVTQNGNSVEGAEVTLSNNDRTITVTFPQILSENIIVTIPVQLIAENVTNGKGNTGIYYTNDESNKATIEYKNFGNEDCTQTVKSPILACPNSLIMVHSYLVNEAGNPINTENKEIPFEVATKLGEPYAFMDNDSSNLVAGTYTITPKDTIEIGDKTYKLQPKTNDQANNAFGKEIALTIDGNSAYAVYFGYSEVETLDYTVEYYKDSVTTGTKLTKVKETFTGGKVILPEGEIAATDKASMTISLTNLLPEGYKADTAANVAEMNKAITKDDKVVKLLCVKDPAKWGTYTVKYYKDSIDPANKIGTDFTSAEVQFPLTVTAENVPLNKNKPAGYKDGVIDGGMITTITKGMTINIVYTKDPAKWGTYTVNYYQDNTSGEPIASITSEEAIYLPATIDPKDISKTESKPDGYQDGVIDGDTTVTKEDNVIKVLYKKDPAKWGTYTVKYYKDSIDSTPIASITSKEAIYLPATIDPKDISKTESKPTSGYKDGVIVDGTYVTKTDNVIKVLYTAIPVEIIEYDYTVATYALEDGKEEPVSGDDRNYKRDQDGERLPLGSVADVNVKPLQGHTFKAVYSKGKDATKYSILTPVNGKYILTKPNEAFIVVFVKDAAQSGSYKVTYFTAENAEATPVEIPGKMESFNDIKHGTAVKLSNIDNNKPVGYKLLKVEQYYAPTVIGEVKDITNSVNSLKFESGVSEYRIIYVIDDTQKAEYKVEYYVDGTLVDALTYYGIVTVANPFVSAVKTAADGGLYETVLGNCILDEENPTVFPVRVATDKLSTIKMYYKTAQGDILPITHEYYLNGTLQTAMTATENKDTPTNSTNLDTTAWQTPKDGYTYTGITIKGILKAMFDKPSENQTELEKMQAELKIMQEAVDSAKLKSKLEDVNALIDTYTGLHNQLKELESKPQTNEAPVVKEEAPAAPATTPTVEAPANEAPATTPTVEAPAKEETPTAPATTPTVEAPATTPVETPATTPTVEAPATTPVEETPAPTVPTVAEEINAIKAEMADIKAKDADLFNALDNLLNMQDKIAATTPAPLALEAEEVVLPKEVTFTTPTFDYDTRYTYTATLTYSKTQTIPDPTPDPEPPYIPPYNPPYEDAIIDEVEVPLAKPEEPDEIVEIVEEIPLGKLPKSGGLHSTALAGSGILALIASMLLKLRKKDED